MEKTMGEVYYNRKPIGTLSKASCLVAPGGTLPGEGDAVFGVGSLWLHSQEGEVQEAVRVDPAGSVLGPKLNFSEDEWERNFVRYENTVKLSASKEDYPDWMKEGTVLQNGVALRIYGERIVPSEMDLGNAAAYYPSEYSWRVKEKEGKWWIVCINYYVPRKPALVRIEDLRKYQFIPVDVPVEEQVFDDEAIKLSVVENAFFSTRDRLEELGWDGAVSAAGSVWWADADLREADLREMFLVEAYLRRTNFEGADLCGADLSRANLKDTRLVWADLRGANLKGAELEGADLSGARADAQTQWSEDFDPRSWGVIEEHIFDDEYLKLSALRPPAVEEGKIYINRHPVKFVDTDTSYYKFEEPEPYELEPRTTQEIISGDAIGPQDNLPDDAYLFEYIYRAGNKWIGRMVDLGPQIGTLPRLFHLSPDKTESDIGYLPNVGEMKLFGFEEESVFDDEDIKLSTVKTALLSKEETHARLKELGWEEKMSAGLSVWWPEANLVEVDLRKLSLRGANLSGANLSGANLSGADLRRAYLGDAFLIGANLSGADLRRTNLSRADLSGAKANASTKWPEGFNPEERGVIMEHVFEDDAIKLSSKYRQRQLRRKILEKKRNKREEEKQQQLEDQPLPNPQEGADLKPNNNLFSSTGQVQDLLQSLIVLIKHFAKGLYGLALNDDQAMEAATGLLDKLGDEIASLPTDVIVEQLKAYLKQKEVLQEQRTAEIKLSVPGIAILSEEETQDRLRVRGWKGDLTFAGGVSWPGTLLRGEDLVGANLVGANFSGAILEEANLEGASLREADLREADLRRANLREADLSGADLDGADLRWADLSGAKANIQTKWPDRFDPELGRVIIEKELVFDYEDLKLSSIWGTV